MSCIRFGTELPSGKKSSSYVFGEKAGMINMGGMSKDKSAFISYIELRQLFKTRTYDEIKAILIERLDLEQEEADYVCERLPLIEPPNEYLPPDGGRVIDIKSITHYYSGI